MVVVKDQLDPNLRKLIKGKKPAAVIPVGSIEQHGPHLPVSTDSEIVTEIALRLAKNQNFLLLPTIFYGVSFEHSPFFNLSVKPLTLQKLLFELCLSLSSNGIETVFIINGHYTNHKILKRLENKVNKISRGKLHVFVFSYWNFMKNSFDHAGFIETSLMLAISNQVKMKHVKKGLTTDNLKSNQILKLKKIASKSFPKATKNGVWGDPRNASKSVGVELLTEIVRNLEKKCQTCLTGKNPKLHQ